MIRIWSKDDGGTQDFFFIEESAIDPGYFFSTHVRLPDGADDAFIESSMKPVRADVLRETLDCFETSFLGVPYRDVPRGTFPELEAQLLDMRREHLHGGKKTGPIAYALTEFAWIRP
jgi:hypothetical protein